MSFLTSMSVLLGLGNDFKSAASLLILGFLMYSITIIIYNIFFHPLAGVKGPLLWRATRLGFIYSLVAGNLVVDVKKLHEIYGDVVRTAPDEVSFAREEAWHDVFSSYKQFPRNQTFFKAPPGQPDNLITTVDQKKNTRMRQVVMPAFTERALAKQEPVIQSYARLMIGKLVDQAVSTNSGETGSTINIVDWLNWFTFDVIGELTLGESFNCLRNETNHQWVSLIFNSIKMMALAAATRYYIGLEPFLIRLLPPRIRKMQSDHYATALGKIHRRMNRSTAREDFMTPMLNSNNPNFTKMSLEEIESTTALLLVAGSETTGTTLCGTINLLVQNPIELRKLEHEIRSNYKREEELTFRTLQTLPFLNAVIHEGLRLCNPVAGGLLRVAPKGGATVCGHFLPEGTHVTVNSIAMAMSERNFHRNKEFLPDRFLPDNNRPVRYEMDRRNVLKPFGLGARGCLGKSVALAELRLVLARLVWTFDLKTAPGEQINWLDLKNYVVVQKRPIKIRIKLRKLSKEDSTSGQP